MTLKDLDKLFQLCQKRGVTELEFEDVKLKIELKPSTTQSRSKRRIARPEDTLFDPGFIPPGVTPPPTEAISEPDMPSDDELLFYSAGIGEGAN